MAAMPGSYPDSIPPTPDETMQQQLAQQQQVAQQDQYGHRQRNKLHKPGDPRGQAYDSECTHPSAQPRQQDIASWCGSEEAIRTETITRDYQKTDHNTSTTQQNTLGQPAGSSCGEVGDTTPTQQSENSHHSGLWHAAGGGLAAGLVGGVLGSAKSHKEYDSAGSDEQDANNNNNNNNNNYRLSGGEHQPPYWGSLPSKGVYNTVVGHGSQDDAARRHTTSTPANSVPGVSDVTNQSDVSSAAGEKKNHWHTGAAIAAGAGAAGLVGACGAAALSAIPEKQKSDQGAQTAQGTGPHTSQHTGKGPLTGISQDAPGFLSETAAGDNTRLAEAASRRPGHNDSGLHSETTKSTHRAFPLAGTGHTSTTEDQHQPEQHESSPSKYGTAAATGEAGLGAGAAATKYVGKRRRGSTAAADRDRHETAGHSSQQRSSPPVEKTSSHEEDESSSSPKSEKKHRILGLFHRHKEHRHEKDDSHSHRHSNDQAEPVKQQQQQPEIAGVNATPNRLRKPSSAGRRRSPDYSDEQQHSSHNTEKAAAGAATAAGAGAGSYGPWNHHRNQKSVSEKQVEDTPTAASNNNKTGRAHRSLTPATAATGGAGSAGEAGHRVEKAPTPVDHSKGVFAQEPATHSTQHGFSGVKSAEVNKPDSYNNNTFVSSIPTGVPQETAREVDQHNQTSVNPAHSAGHEDGKYGALASGTAAASHTPAHNTTKDTPASPAQEQPAQEYNVLPSGVKVKPRSVDHSRETSESLPAHGQSHQQTQNLQQQSQKQPFQPQFQHPPPQTLPQTLPQQQSYTNPALAAATTSWASNAGKSSGVPDRSVPNANTNTGTAAGLVQQQQQQGEQQQQPFQPQFQQHQQPNPQVQPQYLPSQIQPQNQDLTQGSVQGPTQGHAQKVAQGIVGHGLGGQQAQTVGGQTQTQGPHIARCQHCGGENDISEHVQRFWGEGFERMDK